MASKPLESLRSLWHLASTAFFWAALTRFKISSVCKSVGVIHISSDKNHVDSFETDRSIVARLTKQTWYNLFDLSILEMKCALFDLGIPAFDWGIPAFPILEICLVCAAFWWNLSRVRCILIKFVSCALHFDENCLVCCSIWAFLKWICWNLSRVRCTIGHSTKVEPVWANLCCYVRTWTNQATFGLL